MDITKKIYFSLLSRLPLYLICFLLINPNAQAADCDQITPSASNEIFVQFYEASSTALSASPTSLDYNQALGLQGSLTNVTITLNDSSFTPTQYIGHVANLFQVLSSSPGVAGMTLRLVGALSGDPDPSTGRPAINSFEFTLTCDPKSDTTRAYMKTYTVQVAVISVNSVDGPPVFLNSQCSMTYNGGCTDPQYIVYVQSNANGGIVTVYPEPIQATDVNNPNTQISYSFVSGVPTTYANYFSIDPKTGVVEQMQAISRMSISSMQITIMALENTQYQQHSFAQLYVNITRINEYVPIITSSTGVFTGYISENAPAETLLLNQQLNQPLQITATDPGQLPIDPPTPFAISITGTSLFTINQDGYFLLTASNSLNYDTTPSLEFTVVVAEVEFSNPKTSSVAITVMVLQANDHSPVFPAGGYQVTVKAGHTGVILQLNATDADTGALGVLIYSLLQVSNNGGSNFVINSGGTVSVVGPLYPGSQYDLLAQAVDSDPNPNTRRSAETLISVTVVAGQILPPQFSSSLYQASVSEGVLLASSIITVSASDPENNPVNYGILSGNVNNTFSINSVSGVVTNLNLLDRVTLDHYGLILSAVDNITSLSSTSTLSIIVTGINKHSPVFASFGNPWSVMEQQSDAFVGQVQATDLDLGLDGLVVYSVPAANGFFSIDHNLGNVYTTNPLNFTIQKSFLLLVTASDSDPQTPRSTCMLVDITVLDANDRVPTFSQSLYQASVPEGQSNYPVVTVYADDPNSVPNRDYMIVEGNTGLFAINQITGLITTIAPLVYDTSPSYVLVISTTQATENLPQYSCTVDITVLLASGSVPVFNPNYYNTQPIPETDPPGTGVQNVSALRAESTTPNTGIQFSIASVQPVSGQGLFLIYPESGEIILAKSLSKDISKAQQYLLTIYATDFNIPPQTGSATVNVVVVRDLYAPVFNPTYYTASFDFTQNVGSVIATFIASDQDNNAPYNHFTYEIVGDGNSPTFFTIDPNTGQVTINKSLSLDTSTTYIIRVEAIDAGGRFSTAILNATVNRNLYTPLFSPSLYTATILESQPFGTPFLSVTAVDYDLQAPDNIVQYTLYGDQTALKYFMVDVNMGNVSLKQSVSTDPAKSLQYNVQISAHDKGVPVSRVSSNQALVTVFVSRDLYAPIFSAQSYSAQILANATVGTLIITVSATDADTPTAYSNLSYSLIGDDNATTYFAIASATGVIELQTSVLYDTPTLYRIRTMVQDSGSPPLSATVIVYVTVVRDLYAPTWVKSNASVTILETQPLGVPFFTASAHDKDLQPPNNVVLYQAVGDQKAVQYFQVDAVSGNVSVLISLLIDPNSTLNYELSLVATNQGVPQRSSGIATLNIQVIRDQYPPVFVQQLYSVNVSENVSVGAVIVNVTATDKNPPDQFGLVRYMIIGDETAPQYFTINSVTGLIQVSSSLVNDTVLAYQLRIEAYDNGTPPKTNVAIVKVYVARASTLSTQPTPAVFSSTPCSTQPTTTSTTPMSTTTTTTTPTTTTTTTTTTPPTTTTTTTTPTTTTIDYSPPVFLNASYTAYLLYTDPVGYYVTTVSAVDSPCPHGPLYSIVGDGLETVLFTINNSSGQITVATSLNSDTSLIYTILVLATTSCSPSLKISMMTVQVHVNRNEFAPQFITAPNNVTILETQPVGSNLTMVHATDADVIGNRITYSLSADKSLPLGVVLDYYFINPVTGVVYLSTPLTNDPSKTTAYQLVIVATDSGIPPRNLSVTVDILVTTPTTIATMPVTTTTTTTSTPPMTTTTTTTTRTSTTTPITTTTTPTTTTIDYSPPVFLNASYTASLLYTDPVGYYVTTVSAVDSPCPHGPLYSIVGDGLETVLFTINNSSGQITVATSLNSDTSLIYTILVLATSSCSPSLKISMTTLQVHVNRNEFVPQFITVPNNVTILETQPVGSSLTTVHATDADVIGNSITYSLSADKSLPLGVVLDYYFINPVTGVVYLSAPLTNDLSRTTAYQLVIVATDSGIPPRNTSVTVDILVTTPITTTATTPTTTTTTTTPSTTTTTTTTTRTSTTTPITTTTTPTTTTIDYSPPVFLNASYTASLLYTDPVGYYVTTVSAVDSPCPDGPLYSIVGNGLATVLFTINNSSGQITVATSLNSDTSLTYMILVVATTSCSPSLKISMMTVQVHVNRNEFAPQFITASNNVTILETQPVGSNLTMVHATDADMIGNSITYSLSADKSLPLGVVLDYYFINPVTGVVYLSAPLTNDPSKTTAYQLVIVATDSGLPPRNTSVIVDILIKRNLRGPSFIQSVYSSSMAEGALPGTIVATVIATDGKPIPIAYSLIFFGPGFSYFAINNTSGQIILLQSLADSCESFFNMSVVANDQDEPPLEATAFLAVTVLRNIYAPQFMSQTYVGVVGEYSPINALVVTVSAADANPSTAMSGQFTYQLIATQPNYFTISPSSGTITVEVSLYLASIPKPHTYNLTVMVVDAGRPPKSDICNVTVTVLRNDYSPVFSSSAYQISVNASSTQYNLPLLSVVATDEDGAKQNGTPNAIVSYEIDPANVSANTYFSINHETGDLFLVRPLPAEPSSYAFTFAVIASDAGVPQRSTNATIAIVVLPLPSSNTICTNINQLRFTQLQYYFEVGEDAVVNSIIGDVDIINQMNSTVTCSILYQSSQTFGVRYLNNQCQLYILQPLDYAVESSYDLTIGINKIDTSSAVPSLLSSSSSSSSSSAIDTNSTTVNVTIFIQPVNNKPPVFIFQQSSATLPEQLYIGAVAFDAPVMTRVLQTQAVSTNYAESVNGRQVVYTLTNNTPGLYNAPNYLIGQYDGSIYTTATFTAAVTQAKNFSVIAKNYDGVGNSTALVSIFLVDDKHRWVITFPESTVEEIYDNFNNISAILQKAISGIVVIEKIQSLSVSNGSSIGGSSSSSASPGPFQTPAVLESVQTMLTNAGFTGSGISRYNITVAPPGPVLLTWLVQNGSGIYGDGPWIALICFGAIIAFFTFVAMIIMCITWEQYKRCLKENGLHLSQVNEIQFMEQKKEIEIQGLAMTLPPEPLPEHGVIHMPFATYPARPTSSSSMQFAMVHDEHMRPFRGSRNHLRGSAPSVARVSPVYIQNSHQESKPTFGTFTGGQGHTSRKPNPSFSASGHSSRRQSAENLN